MPPAKRQQAMPDPLPHAVVAHSIGTRTRLRMSQMPVDGDLLGHLAKRLSALPGVAQVVARRHSGSLIVYHSGPLASLLQAAGSEGVLDIDPPEQDGKRFTPVAEPHHWAVFGFLILALWQAGRGKILPPALPLALYAAEIGRFFPLESSKTPD